MYISLPLFCARLWALGVYIERYMMCGLNLKILRCHRGRNVLKRRHFLAIQLNFGMRGPALFRLDTRAGPVTSSCLGRFSFFCPLLLSVVRGTRFCNPYVSCFLTSRTTTPTIQEACHSAREQAAARRSTVGKSTLLA